MEKIITRRTLANRLKVVTRTIARWEQARRITPCFTDPYLAYLESEAAAMLNKVRFFCEPVDRIPSDILTTEEVAELIGVRESTVRRWLSDSDVAIPHWRFNEHVARFSLARLKAWMQVWKRQKRRKPRPIKA